MSETSRRIPRRLRRTLQTIGVVAAALVLVVTVVLALPFTRHAMLRKALDVARASLPGELVVERATWPGLLRFELEGIDWRMDATPLLRVDEIVVDVSPRALMRRDLVVRELRARIPYLDVAALVAAFADTAQVAPAAPREPAPVPYLRTGALAGMPSLALERIEVTADSVVLAPDQRAIDLGLAADLDLLHQHRPVAHVDARGHDANERWRLEALTLALDADARQAQGHLRAQIADVGLVEMRLSPRGDQGMDGTLTLAALESPLLEFTTHAIEDDREIVGFELDGTLVAPATDDLARVPALAEALISVPSLEAVRGRLDLTLRTAPEPSMRARLTLEENAWLSSFTASVMSREGIVDVEQLEVQLPQLALQLEGRASPTLDLAATVTVTGNRWLTAFAPDAKLPDPMDVRLSAQARGTPEDLDLEATVQAYVQDHGVALTAVARATAEHVDAKVSPVAVHRGRESRPLPAPSRVNVTFDRLPQRVEWDGLRIDGDYGRATTSGAWHSRQPSRITLDADWPRAPRALVVVLPDSLRDDIFARWPTASSLHLEANVTPRGHAMDWTANARLDVPGPATFAPMLGSALRVDDLGPVQGTLEARGTTDSLTTRLLATADLSATAWIDSARVRLEGTPEELAVSAGLKLLDALAFSTHGQLIDDSLDFTMRLDLAADSLLTRLQPPPEETTARLAGDLTLTGTLEAPELRGRLEGSASRPGVDVPALVADLFYRPDRASVDLALPAGVTTNQVRLETLTLGAEATLAQEARGPIEYHVAAHGPEIDLDHRGIVTFDDRTHVVSDQMRLSLRGQDLSLREPLRLSFGTDPSVVTFEQVDLQGTLGSISASGSLGREVADVQAAVTLALPEKPAELALPHHLWPRAVELDLRATGPRALTASLDVKGISPDGQNPVQLTADATLDSALVLTLLVQDESQRYVQGDARLAFDWNQLAQGGDPVAGSMEVELSTQDLPVPATWLGEKDPRLARIDATLSAHGTLAQPVANTQVQVSFPGWPRVGNWVARLESDLTPEPEPELNAKWHLARAGANLLSGDASLPLRLRPPGLDAERTLRLTTESTTLPLRDIDELLPADIGMDGAVDVDFLVEGSVEDPRLQGHITLKDARAKLADGSSLTANGRVDIGGRARLPELRGSLRIQQGILVIPDTPPSLLPADGTSMLWRAAAAQETVRIEAKVPSAGTPMPMDLDLTVDIPSGLWVRGKGLEMEVAGTLRMKRAPTDSLPTITGELAAVRGRFAFLGHDFTLERGAVSFFGSALTPELDARLGTEVGTTRVRVIVTGNASKPQLKLESEPEMTEGDITSLLLFGRPLDELDDDQLGLVRHRTNDVAKSFGIAAVQGQVRQRLGVDLLQIDTGNSGEPGSVLVGKYLAPNILLKYEQMLQETTAFLVNLEYLLTRRVRVETSYGRRMPSGVEVNWTKDY